MSKHWRLTGFYGSPVDKLCPSTWTLLKHLRGSDNVPWLIGGDFNEILHHHEKFGGKPKSDWALLDSRLVVDECGLIDMGFSGDCFTWVNRREGRTAIQFLNGSTGVLQFCMAGLVSP